MAAKTPAAPELQWLQSLNPGSIARGPPPKQGPKRKEPGGSGAEDGEEAAEDGEEEEAHRSDRGDDDSLDEFMVRSRRNVYSAEAKVQICEMFRAGGQFGQKEALAKINAIQGYEKVSKDMIRKWMTPHVHKQRGKQIDYQWEELILSHVIVKCITDFAGNMLPKEDVVVKANAGYSIAVFKHVAKELQKKLPADSPAKHLKLSVGWFNGFKERNNLHRRRVTSEHKVNRPSIDEVRAKDIEITNFIDENNLGPAQIFSIDETNCSPATMPRYQYIPAEQDRAAAPSASGSRFTLMVGVNAAGELMPPFMILGNTVATADASSSTVIKSLHKEPGFTPLEGWQLMLWERKLPIEDKKKKEVIEVDFKRNYLVHSVLGTVISSQHHGWMDTAGLVMWLDTVVLPYQLKLGMRILIIGDNCGSHRTLAVRQAFAATDAAGRVTKKEMAPNITDCKQVCDIAFNGALKQRIIKERVAHLYNELQAFKQAHDKDITVVFKPAPISTHAAMQMVMRTYSAYAEDGNFKAGITRAFVKVGYLKDSKSGHYNIWNGIGLGGEYRPNRLFFLEPAPTEVGLIGTLIADAEMKVVRRGDDEDIDEGLATGEEVVGV